ncbi:hypothetical protein [Streptomyces sp. NPDC017673]|uniref:hypothetical protein n=1 Tax=unclassified Streptomyces TaxID=2593676 RepID=UPI0037B7A0F7
MNPAHDAPQPASGLADRPDVQDLINGVNAALAPAVPTAYRDSSPVPAIGAAPPVAQPGRPPMSQRATDASALMLSAGVASLPIGAVTIGILLASGHADPVAVSVIAGAPTALVLALARLLRRGRETVQAAPPVHHHHYAADVHQDMSQHHTTTRGLIARTTQNGR